MAPACVFATHFRHLHHFQLPLQTHLLSGLDFHPRKFRVLGTTVHVSGNFATRSFFAESFELQVVVRIPDGLVAQGSAWVAARPGAGSA